MAVLRLLKRALFGLLGAAIAAALAASLLPFVGTKWWLVRLLDFPRLPFGIATLALLVLLVFFARSRPRASSALSRAGLGDGAAGVIPNVKSADRFSGTSPKSRMGQNFPRLV